MQSSPSTSMVVNGSGTATSRDSSSAPLPCRRLPSQRSTAGCTALTTWGAVAAIDARTGAWRWAVQLEEKLPRNPNESNRIIDPPLALPGALIVCRRAAGEVVAFDPGSGSRLWDRRLAPTARIRHAGDRRVAVIAREIELFDTTSGQSRGRLDGTPLLFNPANVTFAQSTAFIATAARLVSVDLETSSVNNLTWPQTQPSGQPRVLAGLIALIAADSVTVFTE